MSLELHTGGHATTRPAAQIITCWPVKEGVTGYMAIWRG
jgi:hypothetical protein